MALAPSDGRDAARGRCGPAADPSRVPRARAGACYRDAGAACAGGGARAGGGVGG